jgi:arylsulfatase A-like enzyme
MSVGDLPRKPNVLLIVTDQEREPMHWPEGWADANLQSRRRLLDHGLQFTNARCNTAACSASRATLMTGLYPAQHGVKNLVTADDAKDKVQRHLSVLPSRLPNLATVMADAGYHSVLKGKFHLTRPVRFDHEKKRPYWSDADVAHLEERYGFHGWNPPDMSDPTSLTDLGGGSINNDGRFIDGTGTAAGEKRPHGDLYRQSAVHFLNTYDGDQPFFLVVCLANPHDVQEYPGRGIHGVGVETTFEKGGYQLEDFEHLPIELPPNLDDDLATKPGVQASMRKLLGVWAGHVRSHKRQLNYTRFYAHLCRQADMQIMKLLDALDANGLTEDTVVIRTSDHGELALSHGCLRQKFYNAYRETLSIPLIVSNPRLYPEPVATDSFVGLVDMLPTLATVAGAREPERYGSKGRDLSPILANPSASVQDLHHFTYEDDAFPVKGAGFIRAVVEEGWKYAVYYDPFTGAPNEYELYDLANDPLELTNLAHPAHATDASELERHRLHTRLWDVMRRNGTAPDEIRWPAFDDYRPLEQDDLAAVGS